MRNDDRASTRRLKTLNTLLQKLRSHSQNIRSRPCKPDNYWAFMVLAFLQRFDRHVNSIERLLDNEDSWLILRSMIEGMLLLKWAAKHPADRNEQAAKYQRYFWAESHRRIRTQENQGRPKDDNLDRIKNITRAELEKVAELILSPYQSNNFFFDDKFDANEAYREITGMSISELFEYSDSTTVKEKNYWLYSAYHHWNPLTLGAYQNNEGFIRLRQTDLDHKVQVLAAALTIYSETIGYAYEIFPPTDLSKIGGIQDTLMTIMTESSQALPMETGNSSIQPSANE
jgi:hypothetical protein